MSSNTDATKKILGFKYQELVALLYCLNSTKSSKIYLESLGDVAIGSKTTEVKHSVDSSKKLIDTHIDFWKTLSNLVDRYDEFRFYNEYVLLTTAQIKNGSIFENWESLKAQDRKKKVLGVTPTETIKSYFDKVKKMKAHELKDILGKFIIKSDQPSAKTFFEEKLLTHNTIISVLEEKDRERFLIELFGEISFYLIKNDEFIWEIDLDKFRDGFRSRLTKYQIGELMFPISKGNTEEVDKVSYRFVDEIKKIDYDSKVGMAVKDYIRASDSQLKMISARPSLGSELDLFDEEILEEMYDERLTHLEKIKDKEELDLKAQSKELFDSCLKNIKSKTTISGVTGVRLYYPKGRVHHQVENEEDFCWSLKNNNES